MLIVIYSESNCQQFLKCRFLDYSILLIQATKSSYSSTRQDWHMCVLRHNFFCIITQFRSQSWSITLGINNFVFKKWHEGGKLIKSLENHTSRDSDVTMSHVSHCHKQSVSHDNKLHGTSVSLSRNNLVTSDRNFSRSNLISVRGLARVLWSVRVWVRARSHGATSRTRENCRMLNIEETSIFSDET